MVYDALMDRPKWKKTLEEDEEFVNTLFNLIAYVSGVDEEFNRRLDDFASSDYGSAYGTIWFQMFGLTPSQVAALPESDVKTVQQWFSKESEKMRPHA